jgi:hypothetical protein
MRLENIRVTGAFGKAFIGCETKGMCGITRRFAECIAA